MKGEILRIAERKELDKKKDPTFLLGLFLQNNNVCRAVSFD